MAALKSAVDRARQHYGGIGAAEEENAIRLALARLNELTNRGPSAAVADSLAMAEAWSVVGRMRFEAAGAEPAKDDFKRAVELYEDALPRAEHVTAQQHADFGVALSVLGRTTDAVQRLQRAIDLGAASAEAHRHLALSALNTDAELAQTHLLKAVELNASDAVSWQTIGDLKARIDPDRATSAYREAGVAHARNGRLPDALRLFERALELRPDDGRLLGDRGEALRLMGRFDEAQEYPTRCRSVAR